MDAPPPLPPPSLPLLPPPLMLPPLPPDTSLSPPIPTPTPTPTSQLFHPFPCPTTPTASPSTTSHHHHRKKRTKFLRIDTPGPTTTKKPDPSAPKITRPCSECGKTFWSWKALFGHMRCHPERQWRGINPPAHLPHPPPPTTTADVAMPDDHEVAAGVATRDISNADVDSSSPTATSARFECSSCKKIFGSHQALGGHRASHKNVKGCFAITKTTPDHDQVVVAVEDDPSDLGLGLDLGLCLGLGLGHRCEICLRVFSSGQALGGHMRCHWDQHQPPLSSSFGLDMISPVLRPREAQCGLDLNLPAHHLEDGSCPSYPSSNNDLNVQLDLRLGL